VIRLRTPGSIHAVAQTRQADQERVPESKQPVVPALLERRERQHCQFGTLLLQQAPAERRVDGPLGLGPARTFHVLLTFYTSATIVL
jgi:hypothetical protein